MNVDVYIPFDKSWIIRLAVLDLINGRKQHAIEFLISQKDLSDDLKSLLQALEQWVSSKIDVGESGTLLRFLRFTAWKQGKTIRFTRHGTLLGRQVFNDPNIINWKLEQLLTLDGGTSQWASAAVLNGNQEKLGNIPFKLKLTYEAVDHWNNTAGNWLPRQDATIASQARAFINALESRPLDFKPQQAEDYCFARAFDLMSPQEGEKLWPALRNHESDRIKEMELAIRQSDTGAVVNSKDHRVIQAVVMRQTAKGRPVQVAHPSSVNKSWPQFWSFIEESSRAQSRDLC